MYSGAMLLFFILYDLTMSAEKHAEPYQLTEASPHPPTPAAMFTG